MYGQHTLAAPLSVGLGELWMSFAPCLKQHGNLILPGRVDVDGPSSEPTRS
jgi:hypothetical protein